MSEVDLIPEDYRQAMKLRRFIKSFFIAFGAVILLVLFGKGLLSSLVAREKSATEILEAGKISIATQRSELDKLRTRQAELQKLLTSMESLQGGPSAEKVFDIISRAVNESVWFTNLKCKRMPDGLAITESSNNSTFFSSDPPDEKKENNENQGRLLLEISGQALNHAALADLAKRFLDQQEIEDVHIVNTSTMHYPAGLVVAYNLTVLINSEKVKAS